MHNYLAKIKEFQQTGLSIRVEKDGLVIFESREPMLKPLLQCLQQYGDKMVGATVIDKIVGLAAAYLCIIGGVARVVTPLASLSAQKILQQHDIQLQAWRITPLIMNRENTGPCPMEQLASTFDTPEAFFQKITESIK